MVSIDGHHLTIDEVVNVSRFNEKVEISEQGINDIKRSYANKMKIVNSGLPVYGINTGFGIFADKRIADQDSAKLSRNLIISHAVGTGTPLSNEFVRAAMLVRANTLAKGFSGVRVEVVQTLLDMLSEKFDSGYSFARLIGIVRRFRPFISYGISIYDR